MTIVLLIGCLSLALGAASPSPMRWSPDGRWLAFVDEVRSRSPEMPFRLFETGPAVEVAGRPDPTSYRLWTFSPQDGESVLLEDSPGPLSGPSWSRDGTKLAFGRLVDEPNGALRWELVVQDAPKRQRVLLREVLERESLKPELFREIDVAWSPDGRLIAVPSLKRAGLLLIRADNGQVLRVLEGGRHACWSGEESKLAYFRGQLSTELVLLDAPGLEPRRLIEVVPDSLGLPGPFWSRDNHSLLFLRLSNPAGGPPGRGETLKLMRVRADSGQTETVLDLIHDRIPKASDLLGAWYSQDIDGEAVAYSTLSRGQPTSQLSWCQARPNEVQKRLNPLDGSVMQGSMAIAPGGKGIALRFFSEGRWSPPGLCDPFSEQLVCVGPDDSSRRQWLDLLLRLMRETLSRDLAPAALADGTMVGRPSLLPAPGELEPGSSSFSKLRRLARMAEPLSRAASSQEEIETRLFVDYLAQRYEQALGSVEELLEKAEDSAARRRLLGVQAQILLATNDLATAGYLIDHLRRTQGRPGFELEQDLSETTLSPRIDPRLAWPDFLTEKLQALRKPLSDGDTETDQDEDPLERELRRQAVPAPNPRAGQAPQPF